MTEIPDQDRESNLADYLANVALGISIARDSMNTDQQAAGESIKAIVAQLETKHKTIFIKIYSLIGKLRDKMDDLDEADRSDPDIQSLMVQKQKLENLERDGILKFNLETVMEITDTTINSSNFNDGQKLGMLEMANEFLDDCDIAYDKVVADPIVQRYNLTEQTN
jgi:hypothetical protein